MTLNDLEWPFYVKVCLGIGMPWICLLMDAVLREWSRHKE